MEGIIGQAKTYHGMSRARFRDLKKVEIQLLLTVIVLNLKKMVKMLDVEEIKSRLSRKFTDIAHIVKDIFKKFIKKWLLMCLWQQAQLFTDSNIMLL